MKKQQLLILDINGVLGYKINKNLNIQGNRFIELKGNYNFLLRKGIKKFLNHCYKNYIIGFYSSTGEKNAKPILDKLLTEKQRNLTRFEWFRDRTEFDPETVDFETIKNLERIFFSPAANSKRVFSINNTIIVDDELKKVRFNNPKNCVIVKSAIVKDESKYINEMIKLVDDAFMRLEAEGIDKELSKHTSEKLNIDESLKKFDDNADNQWQEYCHEMKKFDLLAETKEEESEFDKLYE